MAGLLTAVFPELLTRAACTIFYLQVQRTGGLDGEPDAAEHVPRPHDPQELVLRCCLASDYMVITSCGFFHAECR